ncbi:TlpA disulfide reductase family protein [Pseudomonas sp. SG20056]|uniref:TlpA disulfide reductase family protein n=1 Tax=unclassified Pseudomonas TaxID=196821 RepID=UPI00214FD41C|nr:MULTISPECIES: TlpA disulfide reductase family protein [unclassified Pseudomonas]MCR4511166.1 TlpA family protein disulfide reductase [Pseudomonas sp. 32.2.56]WNF48454.1 TlpA disulfide reductase family protein [Pseudomonas sp. SG20056]
MGMRFQAIIRAVAGVGIGLILAGCAEDIGVDQYGRKVAVERLEGQWLVINYWAQWCAPCRTEIPELNALEKQLKAQSVQVLGVNFDGLLDEKLSQASQDMGISFTVLAQDPAERYQLPRAEVLPVTYIVDPQGRMRERLLGEQTAAGLTARLAALKAQE